MPPMAKLTEPTNWGDLKPLKMRLDHIKAELEVRNLDFWGGKDVLIQRLIKQLGIEQAEEERLAAIRKGEKAALVAKYVEKYKELEGEPKFIQIKANQAEEAAIKRAAAAKAAAAAKSAEPEAPWWKKLFGGADAPAGAADTAPSDGEGATAATPAPIDMTKMSYFNDPDALLWTVEKGDVAVLKGSWVINQAGMQGRLGTRAQLDAKQLSPDPKQQPFFTVEELRSRVKTLGEDWGNMMVCYSCRAADSKDPDPDGYQMKCLSGALKCYTGPKPEQVSPLMTAWKKTGSKEPVDVAVFVTFASIAKPCTPKGLEFLGLWMCNRHTVWWKNGPPAPACAVAVGYDKDAFCQFEAHMGSMMKKAGKCVDLEPFQFGKPSQYANESRSYSTYVNPRQSRATVNEAMDVVGKVIRSPPELPDNFNKLFDGLEYPYWEAEMGGKEAAVAEVKEAYLRLFSMATMQLTEVEWNDNEWGPKDATKVKQMLGNFDVLVKFDLSNVQIGYDGAETLFEAIAKMDTAAQLISLKVSNARIVGKFEAFNEKEGRMELMGAYEKPGIVAATDMLKRLKSLEILDLSYNYIEQVEMDRFLMVMCGYIRETDKEGVELAPVLPEDGDVAMPCLKYLNLSYNEMGKLGTKWILVLLNMPSACNLKDIDLRHTRLMSDNERDLGHIADKVGATILF